MRHVSRTHRGALEWLFDRINLDPKVQIKYIGTKNQLADILTKGNFTRDEWNHLLCLFNLSHFSSTVCSAAMATGLQQESGKERVTAKSVKSKPPNTEKWLRKLYDKNYNNDKSNETKHETIYSINNKCNDMNTRNMPRTSRLLQSRRRVSQSVVVVCCVR